MKKILPKIYKIAPHIIFVLLIISTLIQADYTKDIRSLTVFFVYMAFLEGLLIIKRKRWAVSGIFTIVYAVLLIWSLHPIISGKDSFLFPPPHKISEVLVIDIQVILKSIFSSLWLLLASFCIALLLGIGLGIICGKNKRLQNMALPIARVLSPVPALIYAPYVVAVMPTFTAAAIFIISSGLFWPIFINVIVTIQRFDPKLRDTTEVMNLKHSSMMIHVLLPYCMPSLFNTLAMQISNAFLLLIGAELMGMDSGLGWYVKYNSDFSDYVRVLAGFIVIGVIIAFVNGALSKLKKKVLLWNNAA